MTTLEHAKGCEANSGFPCDCGLMEKEKPAETVGLNPVAGMCSARRDQQKCVLQAHHAGAHCWEYKEEMVGPDKITDNDEGQPRVGPAPVAETLFAPPQFDPKAGLLNPSVELEQQRYLHGFVPCCGFREGESHAMLCPNHPGQKKVAAAGFIKEAEGVLRTYAERVGGGTLSVLQIETDAFGVIGERAVQRILSTTKKDRRSAFSEVKKMLLAFRIIKATEFVETISLGTDKLGNTCIIVVTLEKGQ